MQMSVPNSERLGTDNNTDDDVEASTWRRHSGLRGVDGVTGTNAGVTLLSRWRWRAGKGSEAGARGEGARGGKGPRPSRSSFTRLEGRLPGRPDPQSMHGSDRTDKSYRTDKTGRNLPVFSGGGGVVAFSASRPSPLLKPSSGTAQSAPKNKLFQIVEGCQY